MTDTIDLDSAWRPAGAREFRVGDRVRFAPSPECPNYDKIVTEQARGIRGIVRNVGCGGDHHIWVQWDTRDGFNTSPNELELLDPTE